MTALYMAIGLLVGTSMLMGVVALLQWRYSSIPVVLGFAGAGALLTGVCCWFGKRAWLYGRRCKK
jgi:hypothetical protein